ncbi:MAG: hypothetical protein ACU0B4_10840, partial [Paracoccus sp. (in: a-proteobacteria)]
MPQEPDPAKLAAARAAVALVEDGMKLGLGTGSTASIMVELLGARVQAEGLKLRCAATSKTTADLALRNGIGIESLHQLGWLDELLEIEHSKVERIGLRIAGEQRASADFRHLPVPAPYIAMMPQ